MKDHKDCKRGFHWCSKAWYGKAVLANSEYVDKITIGFYAGENGDQGTTGEFEVSWIELGGKLTPRLDAFNDAWDALFNFGDLLESMASSDGEAPSPAEFSELLKALGVEDLTAYQERT